MSELPEVHLFGEASQSKVREALPGIGAIVVLVFQSQEQPYLDKSREERGVCKCQVIKSKQSVPTTSSSADQPASHPLRFSHSETLWQLFTSQDKKKREIFEHMALQLM